MKKKLIIIAVLSLTVIFMGACEKASSDESSNDRIKITVSIMPEIQFVKEVGGDKVDVKAVIPPGASPANYALTSKEMKDIETSKIYFAIGVNAEENIIYNLKENPDIQIVWLDSAAALDHEDRFFSHDHGDEHGHDEIAKDPHIWVSPKRIISMTKEVERALSELDPDNAKFYKNNAEAYIKRVEEADAKIKNNIKESDTKSFLIFHPALGYFADDYGLEMLTIEKNGKEATAASLEDIISEAREKEVDAVFYQKEFSSEQAKTISSELGIKVIELNILSENVIENLVDISEIISGRK